jgi:nitrite reductase/ring-hydroxylating ferredoxin subunit
VPRTSPLVIIRDDETPVGPVFAQLSESLGRLYWGVGDVRIVSLADAQLPDQAVVDRCSHRGGPLSQGKREGYRVGCPWHDSSFDLRDGWVVERAATTGQPTYEMRTDDGGTVAFRRNEPRALRRNPI